MKKQIKFKIGKRTINHNNRPFIVAEMSGNHNNSLKRAMKIIDAAAKCGADAIKLQTYTADTITLDSDKKYFKINDKESLWHKQKLYDLYNKAHTPWKWHRPLMDHAKKRGIICFSAPFDLTAVDFLEEINCPIYKIASFESNHFPLIEKVSLTKKPVIVSTGMATKKELFEIVKIFKKNKCNNYMFLKCTSSYPASPSESNLITISEMKKIFRCEIGLSDHTIGIGVALASIVHGASLIEKHFTLNKYDGGVDSTFSMDPDELSLLVRESKNAWNSSGKVIFGPSKSERSSLKFKRSIFFSKSMKKGETISVNNIKIIRPADGLEPKYFKKILGKKVNSKVEKGDPLKWSLIKK